MSPAALIGRSRARTRLFNSGSKLFITVYNCRSDPIHFEVFFLLRGGLVALIRPFSARKL